MDEKQIIKALESHGVKIQDQYFKPSMTERKAFADTLKIIDDLKKTNEKLVSEIKKKPKSTHVDLVNLNPPALKKIPEL